jgi:hypothetical protein
MPRIRLVLGVTILGLLGVGSHADAQLKTSQCRGSGGGGLPLAPNLHVAYVIEVAGDSAIMPAVFVGRAAAPGGFRPVRRPLRPPQLPTPEFHLGGATIDTLFMRYDARTRTAWVHTESIPLGRANVILVDRADAVGGAPVVVDTLRAHLLFASDCHGTITRSPAWADTLRARLSLVPEIRAFMARQ